jgi:hypothetical protein
MPWNIWRWFLKGLARVRLFANKRSDPIKDLRRLARYRGTDNWINTPSSRECFSRVSDKACPVASTLRSTLTLLVFVSFSVGAQYSLALPTLPAVTPMPLLTHKTRTKRRRCFNVPSRSGAGLLPCCIDVPFRSVCDRRLLIVVRNVIVLM